MDYYKLSDGTLVGTQADARKSGQKWEPHAVPTDKMGLMEYLNRLVIGQEGAASDDTGGGALGLPTPQPLSTPPAASGACPKCKLDPRAAQRLAEGMTADAIAERIANGDRIMVSVLSAAVTDRIAELTLKL